MCGYNKIMLKIKGGPLKKYLFKKEFYRDLKGLTFLEVMIALFLFTIVLTGFAQRAWVALDANRRSTDEIIATNLRQALMAEIMSKKFAEFDLDPNIGPDPYGAATETRFCTTLTNRFDDVDDYNKTSETPPRAIGNVLLDGTGGTTPNYSGFNWSVSVEFNNTTSSPPPNPVPLNECKKVTVTVITPRGRVIEESARKINNTP